MRWGRERGCKLATIVYDLIPVYYPELCDPAITAAFPAYLGAVSGVDAIWTISDFTMDCLRRFYTEAGHAMPAGHRTVWLPGQLSQQRSGMDQAPDTGRETRMLVVSTLEPRKGHLRLVDAFRRLRASRPHLPLRLVLIGNRYAGAPEIAAAVQEAARRDGCIEWLGPVDDARLMLEFQRAAFTVYASLVEGFGLPILESLWMGRPCLTHNCGVMAELAKGGCLTVDMNDPAEIARAMERLVTDGELLGQLRAEACGRRIPTWQDYAVEMGACLAAL